MSKDGLKRGMVQILLANILNMIFSIGTNFLLPKYLSFDSYSQIKMYQLYITYVAIFHLGYNDGMYLKFGGKKLSEIKKKELQSSLSTLRLFQVLVMICTIAVAVLLKDFALMMAACAILPQNLIAYFKNFFQAVGEFKRYSRIMNLTTGLTFTINLFLIVFIKTDNYKFFLVGYVLLSISLWMTLEKSIHKIKNTTIGFANFSFAELRSNISSGCLLLLGNFSSQLLTSMDRWFVKVLLGSLSFAHYAFAVSMENFLNVATTPISVTLYNYFCKHDEDEDILEIRDLVIAFASFIVATAFLIKFVMEIFLRRYLESTHVIFILFASQIFYIIIKGVYVNLYKSRKMQSKYFFKLCAIVVVAFVFNIICYSICHAKESFAVGTLLSSIVWFFLCQLDFRNLKYSMRHYVYIGFEVLVFLLCGVCFEALIGGIIYLFFTTVMLYICVPYPLRKGVEIVKNIKIKFMGKNER